MHLTLEFGERREGDYHVCKDCGEKTMLVSAGSSWFVDSEPYRSGEEVDDAPDYVEIGEEITGHWCEKCAQLTSLSVNT